VLSSNIVFLGSGTNAPANLILLSTNGNTFTYSYTGTSSGLSNGMQLINSDQVAGYKVTVVSFTEQTNNNTVVVVTRPTLLAELLQQGSLVSGSFTEVINGPIQPLLTQFGLQLNYSYPLNKVLYQDANLQIGTTPGSAVSLAEELKVAANFSGFTLTAFQATLEGTASFQLDFQALAQAAESYSGEVTLIQPVSRTFFGTIGLVPVWLTVVFEIDAGFDASLEAQGTITAGMSASKQVIYGKHWDQNTGWTLISQNPDASFSYQPPAWQIKGSADVTVYLLPKVTLLVDSLAGVTGDLKPHADLKYTFQLNPEECDLGLYAGLDSDLALDLTVWDSKWGQLPSVTFKLIPETLLWHTNCADTAPEIVLEPQAEVVTAGSRAVFEVEAQGSEPMTYQWWRGGLPLTDDGRITGSASATLSLDDVQASDAGGYSVHVSNPFGSTNSAAALLNIFSNSLVFIPPGTFTMGSPTNEAERFPDETQHTVTISRGFWMGKFLVTQGDYLAVVGSNPSYFNGFQQLPGIDYGTDLTRPVEQVDWYDATNYCGLRTQQERAGGLIPTNYVYRLPTESEWEYADRAGTTTAFYLGSGLHSGQANFDGQYEYDASVGTINNPSGIYLQQTTPVGSYAANPWGLYDMIGNVVEWCQDWYGGAYPAGSVTDPQGAVTGSSRVIRGGSLGGFAWFCRSATRIDLNPGTPGHGGIGFRVVLAPGQ
jgi:formylglycine-generating enzyme required for sulfatase activity